MKWMFRSYAIPSFHFGLTFCSVCFNFQPIHEEIKEKEPVFIALKASGEELKESSESSADRDNLQEKLDNVSERWNELNDASDTRRTMLDEAVELTSKYQEGRSHFLPWLDEAERRVGAVQLKCDHQVLESNKQHVEVSYRPVVLLLLSLLFTTLPPETLDVE